LYIFSLSEFSENQLPLILSTNLVMDFGGEGGSGIFFGREIGIFGNAFS